MTGAYAVVRYSAHPLLFVRLRVFILTNDSKNMDVLPKGEARRYGGERDPQSFLLLLLFALACDPLTFIFLKKIGFSLVSESDD
jgi:hypothetical protein